MKQKANKKIAIIGNPNSGKTTLFNLLTGSNQKTGNWSGVTVERIEGNFETENFNITIVDLPGLWGFFSDSLDEIIAKKFLIEEDVDLILTIVDGTMLERSLILTLSLLDRKVPILLAINMCDELEDYGITIYPEKVKQFIPVDAVLISALKGIGVEKLIEAIQQHKPDIVCLSSLLTTTMPNMGIIAKEINALKLPCKLMIGGAVVTKEYADSIGAYYGKDAVEAVAVAKQIKMK